jgi:uncharacterized SAM-binding protein YcdF (DUF218 family)
MESLIGLGLIWLLWLISSRQWRRWITMPIIVVAIGIILTSPIAVALGQWGLTIQLVPDAGEIADAIVILGRGDQLRDSRIAEAWRLWKSHRAPQVFASGMLDARLIAEVLRDSGVPAEQISGEECSQSTQENALFTSTILHSKNIQKILLVTDLPHMLRASLVFKHFGFNVIPVPVDLPSQIKHRTKLQILLREYAGLIKYNFTGLLKSRSLEELEKPPIAIYRKIRDWNCIDKVTGYSSSKVII